MVKHGPRRALPVGAALMSLLCAGAVIGQPKQVGAQTVPVRAAVDAAGRSPALAPGGPIRHVVVIYMENHSFDSLLGYWCDDNPGRCPVGGMPPSVRLSNGVDVTPSTASDVVPNVRHTTGDQQTAIDGGRMDGWWRVPGCSGAAHYRCISGYQPGQVPNLARLASDFAISDATFSMQDSPSWFGHEYAVAATTDGFTGSNPGPAKNVPPQQGWGCDSDQAAQWWDGRQLQQVPSCVPDPALTYRGAPLPNGGAFERTPVPYVPTIMDRLNAAGLPWRLYGALCTTEITSPSGLKECTNTPQSLSYGWAICPTFAELLYTGQCNGLNVAGDGSTSDAQFITDANSGRLPAFSVVTPGRDGDSEHNGFSMTRGDNWLGQLASAVMNGPEWNSTAVFITWDDCGCFYDQVRPGTNPDGTPQGPRVPMVIVSPWARSGYTDSTHTTFAGVLAFAEATFGLQSLGANDAGAYDFGSAFNFGQRPLPAVRMRHRPVPKGDHIRWSQARQDT